MGPLNDETLSGKVPRRRGLQEGGPDMGISRDMEVSRFGGEGSPDGGMSKLEEVSRWASSRRRPIQHKLNHLGRRGPEKLPPRMARKACGFHIAD